MVAYIHIRRAFYVRAGSSWSTGKIGKRGLGMVGVVGLYTCTYSTANGRITARKRADELAAGCLTQLRKHGGRTSDTFWRLDSRRLTVSLEPIEALHCLPHALHAKHHIRGFRIMLRPKADYAEDDDSEVLAPGFTYCRDCDQG